MAVSFIGIFVIVYNLFFWVCGLSHSLAWDYAPGVPQGEEAQRRVPWREKPIGSLIHRHLLRNSSQPPAISPPWDKTDASGTDALPAIGGASPIKVAAPSGPDCGSTVLPVHVCPASSTTTSSSNARLRQILQTLSFVFAPINLVIFGSLFIALVQPLKALFVDVSAEGGPSWKGPDGRPPLAFLLDTGL